MASFFSRIKETRRRGDRTRRALNSDGSGFDDIEDMDDFELIFLKDEDTLGPDDYFYDNIEKAKNEIFL